MFKDDTCLEAVFARYKLGLDRVQVRQLEVPITFHPGWRDRFLFGLGKTLIVVGSRLQQRHSFSTPATVHPAYPAS
jgi:hypothetical protein